MTSIVIEEPLQANIFIHQFKGIPIQSKTTTVTVTKLTTKSLIFNSDLKFPVSEEVIYQLSTFLFNCNIQLYGYIKTSIKTITKENFYEFTYILKEH